MKRSELEIGKVYAYSREARPTRSYDITGFIVDIIEAPKDWRGKQIQTVKGRFTDKFGNPTTEDVGSREAPLRRLIAEYLPLKHDLELRDKNYEIERLKSQIAATKMEGLIKNYGGIINKRIGLESYTIRNQYDGRATITLNTDQFSELVWAFQALDRHEEHAQRQEAERLAKAYEESQVNA
jgi:hypothetical protein